MFGFSKTVTGISIGARFLRAVRIKRGKTATLAGYAEMPLPEGTLLPSYTKGNILDKKRFDDIVRLTLGTAGALKGDISISIPDQVVKVSIFELKDVAEKRSEIMKFVKWKSKKILPYDPESAMIDYQLMKDSAMTVFVKDEVVSGYEDTLVSLGFRPQIISIPSLNLLNFFSPTFGEFKDFAFISVLEDSFSIIMAREGRIDFHRSTDIGFFDRRLVQEINSSVLFYKSENPNEYLKKAFLYTGTGNSDLLVTHLSDSIGMDLEPIRLSQIIKGPAGVDFEPYGTAVAAAFGGM